MAARALSRVEAFRQGLQELGYREGQNITVDYRFAAGDYARLRTAATELVQLNVHVIVTGGPGATRMAQETTSQIPIVMARGADPVGTGFASSLARPGRNITGLMSQSAELSGKRLELLREVVPRLQRVALVWNPNEPGVQVAVRETEEAARVLGLQVQLLEAVNLKTAKTLGLTIPQSLLLQADQIIP